MAASVKPVARVNGSILTDADLLREEYAIFPYARQHGGIPKDLAPQIRDGAMKMMEPAQAGQLTRAEREEVFERSLKASGLDKQPRTPAQEQLVQRMYRTMVLGEAVHGTAPQ